MRYGADALAVAIPVRGPTEGDYIRWLTDTVNAAARYEMPVIAHVYPRDFSDGGKIVFTPDQIAYAVRIGFETGVDVIKVGYTGDFASFQETVATCPVPVVIAGGPKTDTLLGALDQTSEALRAGARGAVVGPQPVGTRRHDDGRASVQVRHSRRPGAARGAGGGGRLTGDARPSGSGFRCDNG